MPIRGTAMKSSNTSTFEVKLVSFKNYEHSGFLFHPSSESLWYFNSTLMFVNIMEAFLDDIDFPQSTHSARSFERKAAGKNDKIRILEKNAKFGAGQMEKPTFIVRVQYRQNATWQGSIQWVEQKKTQQFRSVLEMIKLMEEVVDTSVETAEELSDWDDEEK